MSQEIAYFDQGPGSVSIAVTTNGNLIQQGTAEKLGLSVQAIAAFTASFVVSFIAQWKLTLIVLCVAPLIVIVTGFMAGIDAKLETQILDIYAKGGAFAEDVFSSMRTVHAFWVSKNLVASHDFVYSSHCDFDFRMAAPSCKLASRTIVRALLTNCANLGSPQARKEI